MLDRLRSILRTDAFTPVDAVFPSIDADRLASELRLEKEGRNRGVKGQPETGAGGFDSVENLIIDRVEGLRRIGLQRFEDHRRVYNERLNRASDARREVAIVAGRARTDFEAEVVKGKNGIAEAKSELVDAAAALDAFRRQHGVRRPADLPAGWMQLVAIGLVMIIVESVLNGFIFAEGSAQGLLGGAAIAFLISAVNVCFSGLAGYFARYVNARNWLAKILGLAAIGIWVGFIGFFNLAVGHYRDAMEALATAMSFDLDGGRQALAGFVADPLGFDDMLSWLLVALGSLISIAAFLKGYYSDDAYPGYSHSYRKRTRARDAYHEKIEEVIEQLVTLRDDAIDELRHANELVSTSISEALDALYGRSSLRAHLDAFLAQCNLKTARLLSVYRDANRAARTSEAPAHFNIQYAFDPFSGGAEDNDGVARQRDADSERKRTTEVVEDEIAAIFRACETAINAYREIDDLEDEALRLPALGPRPRRSEPTLAVAEPGRTSPATERLSLMTGGQAAHGADRP